MITAPGLREAYERLDYQNLSLDEQQSYDKYVDNFRRHQHVIYEIRFKSKIEGIVEGIAAVFALLEKGIPLAEAKRQLGM